MAIPTVQAVGTPNHGAGAVTYTLPAHQAGDLLLLFVETNISAGVTAPSGGWAHVANSPRAQGSNVTSANVLWLRASGSGTTNPQVPDPGNHQVGVAVVVRGAVSSGDPWDFAPVGDGGTAQTSVTAAGGTTTVADCLVMVCLANNQDTTTNQFSSVSNGSLSGFSELAESFTTDGNGGGFGAYAGGKSSAGSTGTTSGSQPSGAYAALTFAVKPQTSTDAAVTGSVVAAVASVGSATVAAGSQAAVTTSAVSAVTSVGSVTVFAEDDSLVVNLDVNPSFETGTSGWAKGTASTLGTDATHAVSGSKSLKYDFGVGSSAILLSGPSYFDVPLTDKVWSVYHAATTATGTVKLEVVWFDSGFSTIRTDDSTPVSTTATMQRLSIALSPPGTAYGFSCRVVPGSAAPGDDHWLDASMLTEGTTLYDYFDGDTADGGGFEYSWTGTPHASTSQRVYGTSASLSASTVAGTASIGSATLSASAVRAASTVAAVASVASPALLAGSKASVTATAVAGTASVGPPTLAAQASASPAAVAAVAAVGTTTASAGSAASVTTSAVAAAASVPDPALSASAAHTAAAAAATATVASPTVAAGTAASPAPDTAQAVASVGSPALSAGTAASASPDTVAAQATVGEPDVAAAGAASVEPDTVQATTAVGAPDIAADAAHPAVTVDAAASVGSPGLASDADVAAASVQATADVPDPSVVAAGSVTAAPDTAAAAAGVGAPTATADGVAAPDTIVVVVSVASPALAAGTAATGAVTGTASVGAPTVSAGVSFQPVTVQALASLADPSPSASVEIPVEVVAGTVVIGAPQVAAAAAAVVRHPRAVGTDTRYRGSPVATGLRAAGTGSRYAATGAGTRYAATGAAHTYRGSETP